VFLEQLKENVAFFGICIAVVAGLGILARLAEKYFLPHHEVTIAKRLSVIGICAAIAAVLHMLDFPLLFLAPEFYRLDFSEVAVLMCGFYLGPSAAVACEGLKILLKLLLKGTSTAFVGDFANFAVGCAMVLPAVLAYHLKRTRRGAVLGLAVGTAVLTAFGSFFNALYLIPRFAALYGAPLEAIVASGTAINSRITDVNTLVLWSVAPLNLIKGVSVSLLTFLLYKRVARQFFSK